MRYLIYLFIFLGVTIWLYNVKSEININILEYSISTNAYKLLILTFMIYTPIHFTCLALKKIINKIKRDIFISSILDFINTFKDPKERDTLISVIKYSDRIKFIKQFKAVKQFITNKKYDQALITLDKIQIKSFNETMLLKYRCQIYKLQQDFVNLSLYAKKGLLLKREEIWFLSELYELNHANNSINSEIRYLNNSINTIKDKKHEDYKKYYCLIQYHFANYLLTNNEKEEAKKVIKKTLKQYPDFIPVYEIILKIYEEQGKKNRISENLKNLWKHSNSSTALELWKNFYNETQENYYKDEIKSIETDEDNKSLLLSCTYIKNNKLLEAHNILQSISNKSLNKSFLLLELMKKENNYKNIENVLDDILSSKEEETFWSLYI